MDALKDLKTFFLVLFILAFVWLFTGGPLRPEAKSGWFLFRPQTKHSQKAAQQISSLTGKAASSAAADGGGASSKPVAADKVSLSATRTKETDPKNEYLEIKAPKSNKNPYKITGLILEGKNGFNIAIGQGVRFVFAGVASQPQEDIYLSPGEKAVIATGASSIGTNFQLNKCTGYFEQHNDFNPRLPLNCPLAKNEDLPSNLSDACLDFIDDLPRCKTVLNIPASLPSFCHDFINDNVNYKTCSENHKQDSDFYEPEWRVYLGRSEEFWKQSRETIVLKDISGKIIDSVSY